MGDMGDLPDTLPVFLWPEVSFTLETLLIILPYSASLAVVGLLESLMTATIVDISRTPPATRTASARGRASRTSALASWAAWRAAP